MDDKIEPSTEWTPQERLALISKLAFELKDITRRSSYQMGAKAFDLAERILLLSGAPSSLLEANRNAILHGRPECRDFTATLSQFLATGPKRLGFSDVQAVSVAGTLLRLYDGTRSTDDLFHEHYRVENGRAVEKRPA